MQHKGEIVEKAIRQSGYSITKLAEKLGKSRRWMYLVFDNANVSSDVIIKIGKLIHHDFSDEIKDLPVYRFRTDISEIDEPSEFHLRQQEEINYWRNKYLDLLEKHNDLLTKLNGQS